MGSGNPLAKLMLWNMPLSLPTPAVSRYAAHSPDSCAAPLFGARVVLT